MILVTTLVYFIEEDSPCKTKQNLSFPNSCETLLLFGKCDLAILITQAVEDLPFQEVVLTTLVIICDRFLGTTLLLEKL